MKDDERPGRVLRDAVVLPGDVRPRQGRAWLVGWHRTRGVLRSVPAPADPAALARLTEELAWLHGFLDWLAATGFPAPRPLRAFGGNSWTVAEGALWELVSFLPGQVVGWVGQPPVEDIGAARPLPPSRLPVRGSRPAARRAPDCRRARGFAPAAAARSWR